MKRYITIEDLEYLAIGAAILGSGGGGNPAYDLLMAKNKLEKYGPIELITLDNLCQKDLVVPIGFMGAPLVLTEKLSNGKEFTAIMSAIERYYGQKPTVIMPAEIGGANAFTPILVSAELNIPILDADLLSRAFPRLEMNSASLSNTNLCPAFLADTQLNTVVIDTKDNIKLESLARNITIEMGSSAAIAVTIMNSSQVKKSVIPGTVTQAISIGKIVLDAQKNNIDPVSELINKIDSKLVGVGTIIDVDQSIQSGFLKGKVIIENKELNQRILIDYQNENLVVYINDKVLVTTPDIITIVDSQTGMTITTDALLYGLRVSIIVIRANSIWQSKEGLKLVGPKAFGYDFEYKTF